MYPADSRSPPLRCVQPPERGGLPEMTGYEPLPRTSTCPPWTATSIALWRERKVFQRSLRPPPPGRSGRSTRARRPPTACPAPTTSRPGSSRTCFPRFKTMQGYHVARKAGWDCHGLPVELAVEKELGFTGKPDIEAYGIAEFNDAVPRVGAAATSTRSRR